MASRWEKWDAEVPEKDAKAELCWPELKGGPHQEKQKREQIVERSQHLEKIAESGKVDSRLSLLEVWWRRERKPSRKHLHSIGKLSAWAVGLPGARYLFLLLVTYL